MVRLADVEVPDDFVPVGKRGSLSGCSQFMRRSRVGFATEGPSLTKQSFAADTDVNAIMKKYLSQGTIPVFNEATPRYGDFTSGVDFQETMNAVKNAQEIFLALPIEVQVYCDHDPAKLLDLVYSTDPEARKVAERLKLVEAPKPEASRELVTPAASPA